MKKNILGKAAVLFVFILSLAAVFSLMSGNSRAAVGGTVNPLVVPSQTIRASSSEVALFGLALGTDTPSKSITDITIGFSGTGFATTDLAASPNGIKLYSSVDGTFDGTGETLITSTFAWSQATATVTLTASASIPVGAPAGNNFFIVIRTSATISNNDAIMAAISANGINTDDTNDLPVAGTPLDNALTADTIAPAAINVGMFVIQQSASPTHDFVAPLASVGVSGDFVKISTTGDLLLGQATIGPSGQFAPFDIGNNANAAVKIQVVDAAGNTSGSSITKTGNDITTPTVTSIAAFTDRVLLNLSENVDGMRAMDCSHYTINGTAVVCSGPGTAYVDFQGNKIAIKGLTISGTISFAVVAASSPITDNNGASNPLTYSNASVSVGVLSLPAISGVSPSVGAEGDTIVITGTNFGTTATPGDDSHKVFFSGGFNQETGPLPPVEADYTGASWSATSITVTVPAGASGGPLTVMVDGAMSDMGQNTFFDILKPYNYKIFYDDLSTPMPDGDASKISLAIGSPNGMKIYNTADTTNISTYSAGDDTFTIATVSAMGWTWAFDTSGAHLNSNGSQLDPSATQSIVLLTASQSIAGTVTLGSPCADAGKNQYVVVMAMPEFQENAGGSDGKDIQPAFFKTNGSCVATYKVGVTDNGVYRVETHLPPDMSGSGTVASAPFVDPSPLSVTISDAALTATDKNFTYSSADRRIYGTLKGPNNTNISAQDLSEMFVGAYQPVENGKGTMTKPTLVGGVAKFVLYVTDGAWKINVNGPKIPSQIEAQVDVTSLYTLTATLGPTIVIAPPSDFIEGYVKDATGTGLSNVSIYSWREGGPGGGGTNTDSQGYYKLYVGPGTGYHVGANSRDYGFIGEQSSVTVSASVHPTVNFTITSGEFYTVSGTVTKGGQPLSGAFVFITENQFGPMLGGKQTDASGAYSLSVKPISGRQYYIHVGVMGKGDLYLGKVNVAGDSAAITGNITGNNITVTSDTIEIQISPSDLFDEAFVGVHSISGGAFTNTDVSTSGNPYRQYKLDVQRPGSGTTTYYLDGGIPGYGPLPQMAITLTSGGVFGGDAAASGIVTVVLDSNLYDVSGTVTGSNVLGARVWAGGPGGGADTMVASTSGTFSMKLRAGTYDIGVNKPGYSGNKVSLAISAATTSVALELSENTAEISGTVYLPDGTTPASNSWVWATNATGGWAGSPTDATGNFTLGVTSGEWIIDAAGDGYTAISKRVSSGATGVSIVLAAIAGFDPELKNSPVTPSNGGIVQGDGVKVDFPKNSLGTDTNSGTVEVKKTTNIPITGNTRIIGGSGKEISAKSSTGQAINTLSGAANITLTLTKAEAVDSGLTIDQLKSLKIAYWDSTSNSWSEVNTVTTLSPATAATLDDLDTDPAVTMVGTVTHLSTFAPTLPTNVDAPATPTVTATAGDSQAVLSWAASSGATKYYIYEKSGATYPYLAETTSVSYTKTGLTNGTTYYYKVSAVNASDQESAASSEVSVTPAASSSGSGTVFIPPVSTPSQQPAAAEQSPAKTVTTTSGTTITLVRVAGDYKVYQIVDGVRIWIPTAEAFNALGFNWGDIKEVASDNNKGATLIRAEGDHKVYVLNGNVKKWVKTLEEFNAAGYKWSDVTVVKPGMLLGYTEEGGAATTNVTGQAAKKFVATLLPGTRGAIISQLQQRLKELGYLPQDHTVTQFFGPVTRAAVIKLQKEHSLSPQAGTVGPKTREVLNAE